MDPNGITLTLQDNNPLDAIILFLKRDVLMGRLELECEGPDAIDANEPLFEPQGLGLDSIESLELMAAIEGTYQVSFQGLPEAMLREALYSLRSLAAFVAERMPRGAPRSDENLDMPMMGS